MLIYLYVKTHNQTGLKYFGKTYRDPQMYRGSGLYWKRHIAEHGYDVTTEIIGAYDDPVELTEAAIKFSIENNIVESDEWANLVSENGLDGKPVGAPGHIFTDEEKQLLSRLSKERWSRPDFRALVTKAQEDAWDDERKSRQSQISTQYWSDQTHRDAHSAKIQQAHEDGRMFNIGSVPKTDEHKSNISKALKGKPKSEEHKRKLSEAAKRRRKQ